jgi:hypothetical protein
LVFEAPTNGGTAFIGTNATAFFYCVKPDAILANWWNSQ